LEVRKVKRPGGDFTFTVQPLGEDEHGSWVYGPIGSPWSAPHDSGTLPVDAIALFDPGHWFVTWWVDRPGDRRVEIDISLPPERTAAGWTYVDLELDPIRHEDGTVEVEDHDEYDDACRNGWITPEHAAIALETAQRMADRLRAREEPWGDEGWRRLARARAEVHTFTTAEAAPDVLASVRELLDHAFDDYADADWQNALGGWHVVVTEHDTVVAHASVVPRRLDVGERTVRTGYVESVATAPGREGMGLGSLAMTEIAAIVRREFEMGALSTARTDFYARLGWERWQGPTFVRDGADRRRTEDDDGGLMVLRFGATAHLDLAAPITCDPRPGDDW
jgi:hypothetical protein